MFLALFACSPSLQDSTLTAEAPPDSALEGDMVAGWLRTAAAADAVGQLTPTNPEASGNLQVGEDEWLYFFGTREEVDEVLNGVSHALPAVLVAGDPNQTPCLGLLAELPEFVADVQGGLSGRLSRVGLRLQAEDGRGVTLSSCDADAPGWRLLADAELEPEQSPEGGVEPVSVCTSTCGATESSATYASQTATSNGSSTGSGTSCAGGDSYQCTQFVDKVHGHYGGSANWTGNAYTGYWTSTSNGPYQKGLLPFGSGTSYDAPLAGDVIVWSGGTYGHVGVLASIGSSSVTVYDQNRSCGAQSCTEGYSTSSGYTLANGSGRCFSSTSSYTPVGYARRGWDFGGTYGLASSTSSTNWWPNDATYVSGSSTTSGSVTDITDYIAINPGASDPYLTSPSGLAVPAYSSSATHGYQSLKVYMKSLCSSTTAALYWKRTTDSGFSETRKVTATTSSSWGTVTFTPSSDWTGTIDQIRLDPGTACSSGSSDLVYLRYAYFDR